MTIKHIRGIVIPTIAVISGLVSFFLLWNAWLSKGFIDVSSQVAAIIQWQEIYGKRIDWLVQRNGANPEAITKFISPDSLSNASR